MCFLNRRFIVLTVAFIFGVITHTYAQENAEPSGAPMTAPMMAPAVTAPSAPEESVIEKYADPKATPQESPQESQAPKPEEGTGNDSAENNQPQAEVAQGESLSADVTESTDQTVDANASEKAVDLSASEKNPAELTDEFVDKMTDEKTVVLKSIDKVSALSMTFEIPVGSTVKFGKSLFIKARACKKSSPFTKPESVAFLQIWEKFDGEKESKWIFSGWMYASSPALSAMEHPVYDVWVLECKSGDKTSLDKEKTADDKPLSDKPASSEAQSAEEEIPLD